MWAGVVFLVAGVFLAGLGGFSILVSLVRGSPTAIPAMACEGTLMVLGGLAIYHGIRAVANPGKV